VAKRPKPRVKHGAKYLACRATAGFAQTSGFTPGSFEMIVLKIIRSAEN